MILHQRPGVYAQYTVHRTDDTAQGAAAAGLVFCGAEPVQAACLTAQTQLQQLSAGAAELAGLALQNGAGSIWVLGVQSAEEYQKAFAELIRRGVGILLCDSTELSVQLALREALLEEAERQNECLGVVGMENPTVEGLTQRAAALNCERMVLVGPGCASQQQAGSAGGLCLAAAAAGLIAGETDPSLPVHGLAMTGLQAVEGYYDEATLDLLILSGVSPAETVGGQTSLIRAVTTRTSSGGAADTAWRELTTVRCIDAVIPAVRSRLKTRFSRMRNNRATRSAIRAEVLLELERQLALERIDAYDELTVEENADDPTICDVRFSIVAAHGLSRIGITAHITV